MAFQVPQTRPPVRTELGARARKYRKFGCPGTITCSAFGSAEVALRLTVFHRRVRMAKFGSAGTREPARGLLRRSARAEKPQQAVTVDESGASASINRQRGPRLGAARFLLAALGCVAILAVGLIGYAVATLRLNGGLQVDATPSALTLESDSGEIFATRGVFKGEKLTAAEMPQNLGKAVVAIEDRRFISITVSTYAVLCALHGATARQAQHARAAAPSRRNSHGSCSFLRIAICDGKYRKLSSPFGWSSS